MSEPVRRKKVRLGDLLLEHKVISEEQLQAALLEQKRTGRKPSRNCSPNICRFHLWTYGR
jgi:hypothetical protein